MNKINDQVLGNYLNSIEMNLLERQVMAAYNRGKGVFIGKITQCKSWVKFKEIRDEISRRKIVLAALFPGLDAIECSAMEREWTSDQDVFHYILDWVRFQLLKRTVQIMHGDEGTRGELRIMFSHAKSYFGNDLDHGQEYRFFFSGAALEVMTNFKDGFKRVSFK